MYECSQTLLVKARTTSKAGVVRFLCNKLYLFTRELVVQDSRAMYADHTPFSSRQGFPP